MPSVDPPAACSGRWAMGVVACLLAMMALPRSCGSLTAKGEPLPGISERFLRGDARWLKTISCLLSLAYRVTQPDKCRAHQVGWQAKIQQALPAAGHCGTACLVRDQVRGRREKIPRNILKSPVLAECGMSTYCFLLTTPDGQRRDCSSSCTPVLYTTYTGMYTKRQRHYLRSANVMDKGSSLKVASGVDDLLTLFDATQLGFWGPSSRGRKPLVGLSNLDHRKRSLPGRLRCGARVQQIFVLLYVQYFVEHMQVNYLTY